MNPSILKVRADQSAIVSAVLSEAASWLIARGEGLWRMEDVTPDAVNRDVAAGAYYAAWVGDEAAGVLRFQLEDPQFWPDATTGEAVYLHRFAVRRRHAGGIVSKALLSWTVQQAKELGRSAVRLDCALERPKLRGVYEKFGFRFHSERDMGRFRVARYQFDISSQA